MKFKNINIEKRKDNRYQAVINTDSGKKYLYDKTQLGCYNKVKEYFGANKKSAISYNYTFNDWFKVWFETYKSTNKDSTNKQITGIINLYADFLKDKPIDKITSIEIQKKLNEVSKRSQKQSQRLFITLKDLFSKAKNNRVIEYNPMDAVIRPKYESKEKEAVSKDTINKILNAIKNSDIENLVLFCMYQGTRLGEALALTYEDIDFINNKISINKTNYKEVIGTPKTKKSNRVIPLFNNTRKILNENGTGRIFTINYNTAHKRIRTLLHENNLYDISYHTFRHCFVSNCNELGINQKLISEWVGHTSTTITNKIYTHISNDFECREIAKINDLT